MLDPSESVKDGKRRATEDVEEDGRGKRVEVEDRLQLQRELVEAPCEARILRDAEKRWRKRAEKAEAKQRLQQQR